MKARSEEGEWISEKSGGRLIDIHVTYNIFRKVRGRREMEGGGGREEKRGEMSHVEVPYFMFTVLLQYISVYSICVFSTLLAFAFVFRSHVHEGHCKHTYIPGGSSPATELLSYPTYWSVLYENMKICP